MLLDQVAQRSGPGRGGSTAAGCGLDRPPPLGGQVPGGLQGAQGDVQVPGREGLVGLVGGLDDGRDGPGGLGGDGRVRPRRTAGFRFTGFGAGADWLVSAVLPAGSAADCPASVLSARGASADGASSPRVAGATADVQVQRCRADCP